MIYYLNGVNFKDFGVYVSRGRGLIDGLNIKEPKEMDWDGYHGKVVDLSAPRYESREITLECFIAGPDKVNTIQRANSFFRELAKAGTQRLMIDTGEGKMLVYEVYQSGKVEINNRWTKGTNVGEFTLKLIEPEPVKRVLKFEVSDTATDEPSITLTSDKLVTIFWGDGEKETASGDAITRTHTYSETGTYHIILAGVIEEITGFSTNCEVVWNNL